MKKPIIIAAVLVTISTAAFAVVRRQTGYHGKRVLR